MKTATGQTVIRNGQLVDGTGAAPVSDGLLVIEDGFITYAGSAAGGPTLPPEAKAIDANGGTIMPGLVEAHFHPTYFNVAALEDPLRHSAADAEHRHVAGERALGHGQFERRARVLGRHRGMAFVGAEQARTDVEGAPRDHQAGDHVEVGFG